ncbi:hypothetical protein ABKV19_008962 [Rosa sericea]
MVRDLEREDFIHESFGNVIPQDAEACSIREELDKLMTLQQPLSGSCNNSSETAKDATVEHLKAALIEIQLCSRLESLLLKKKSLNNGDSPELHTEKVEKLKVLSEFLANSTSQAEKRILDHRFELSFHFVIKIWLYSI